MDTKTIEKDLLALETRFWKAIQDGDADAAMKLTDDACIVAGAQGVATLDRKGLAAMMQAPNYTLHEFEIDDDFQVRLVTDDVAVVAYKVWEKLTVDGKPVELDAADSSVWVRRNGTWVCALHTESIAGDPFGRDRRPT